MAFPFGSRVDPNTGNTLSTRQLRVLGFSPSAVQEAKLNETLDRIQHFVSLTGGEDLVIIFLLSAAAAGNFISAKTLVSNHDRDSTDADAIVDWSKLQAEMMNHRELPYVPILPLANLDELPQLLEKHITNITRPRVKLRPQATSIELLQLCTANPPMSLPTAYILSDLFASLEDLASTCLGVRSAPNSSSPTARAAASQLSGGPGLDNEMSVQHSDPTAFDKLRRLRNLVGEQECNEIFDFWKEEWMVD